MGKARQEESFLRLRSDLRQSVPKAVQHLDDETFLYIIKAAHQKALTYQLQSAEAITMFIKMAVFGGLKFDEEPSVNQFLKAPELDPDYKVMLLARTVAMQLSSGF